MPAWWRGASAKAQAGAGGRAVQRARARGASSRGAEAAVCVRAGGARFVAPALVVPGPSRRSSGAPHLLIQRQPLGMAGYVMTKPLKI